MKAEIITSLSSKPAVLPTNVESELAASTGQERMWYITQTSEPRYLYNDQMEVRIEGCLDISLLEHSLTNIVERHQALRTVFRQTDKGDLMQVILAPFSVKVPLIDIGDDDINSNKLEQEISRVSLDQGQAEYDLACGPLFRICVLQLPKNRQIFLFSFHHSIMDGRSLVQLLKEIDALYTKASQSTQKAPDELHIQDSEHAVRERQRMQTDEFQKRLEYWESQLGAAPLSLNFPFDYPRPVPDTSYGAWEYFKLSKKLTAKLSALARREKASLYTVLLAAYKTLLMRYSGQTKISVATVIANRPEPELKSLMGFIAETLILSSDLSAERTFIQLLAELRTLTTEAFYNQAVPFNKLVDIVRQDHSSTDTPLCQAALVYKSIPFDSSELAGKPISHPRLKPMGIAKFDLTLSLELVDDRLQGYFEYNAGLLGLATVKRLLQQLRLLLESVAENPGQSIASLPLLSKSERQRLVVDWNNTGRVYPAKHCVQQLFEQQAETNPDAIALVYEDQQLSYQDLNNKSNQLAHYLIDKGIGPEVRVGLCVERSLNIVIGILAILKAGGAYVPIDPNNPSDRIEHIVNDSAISVLLTQTGLLDSTLQNQATTCICLDRDWLDIEQSSSDNPPVRSLSENLAYVIYTSGSTGLPKGTLVTHANVARLFANTQADYQFNSDDIWTLFHSFAFDFSVWELWGALCYGGKVIVVPYWISREPERFCQLVYEQGVTVLNQTPSAFNQFITADKALGLDSKELALRYVIFGGEALELKSLEPWFERHGDQQPQLVNMYGITETTVHVTYRPLKQTDVQNSSSVIGHKLSDLQTYILDQQLQPVPIGVPGELYVGGGGVARGYLNRPDLSAQRFIPNAFSKEPGARLYKTGDLARYLPDGDMQYQGRIDQQVKIRGFRIELGEIENALTKQYGVKEAVVLAHSRGSKSGNQYLAAYVVADHPEKQERELDQGSLQEGLKQFLPEYMLPSFFVFLDQLPLTSNGKLDRKALPEPDTGALSTREYIAPRTKTEKKLVGIWAKVLNLPANQIGINASFTELGGHSLLATRMIGRINTEFNSELKIRDLSIANTIHTLAAAIGENINTRALAQNLIHRKLTSDSLDREEIKL